MEWREQAVCARLSWDHRAWFFGEGNDLAVHEQHERARMVCYVCPVQMDCLQYWVDIGEESGIWGGLTVSQRKRYLMPQLRRTRSSEDAAIEVVWNLGLRLFPKIEAAYQRAGESLPDLPAQVPPSRTVLVEILSPSRAEAA